MDFEPGIYECVSEVKIRREPQIIDAPKTNQVGLLKPGMQREIYSVITLKDNSSWGRVSSPDAAGISEWVCIQHLNRNFMKLLRATPPAPLGDLNTVLLKLDNLESGQEKILNELAEIRKR